MRKVVAVALVAAALSACAGPVKREYVLGAPGASHNAPTLQTALPVVQIERVLLPDYLDTRDIVTRSDREVVASETGRWAERLSVGTTRALAATLAAQLRGVAVTSAQPIDPPVLRVVVDVVAFDATAGGPVVLAARWTITDGSGQRSLVAEQVTVTEPVSGARDGAVVAAMSLAIEKLAKRISAGIEPNLAQGRHSRQAFMSNLPARQFSCVIETKET
jgi:cholesterol transport system auxiliary component